jgi:hypothetical protein
MIDTLQRRYDLRRRKPRNDESVPQVPDYSQLEEDEERATPRQAAFPWTAED